jgi:hypothetical protein
MLPSYRTSPRFTDLEKLVLDYAVLRAVPQLATVLEGYEAGFRRPERSPEIAAASARA